MWPKTPFNHSFSQSVIQSFIHSLSYIFQSFILLFQFGIFAAGLENLLGEEVEPGQEDVEATAGISLDLIDVSLRPISFFHGQSGLMGAVWSAPSEPTSALQVGHSNSKSTLLCKFISLAQVVPGPV